MRVRFPRWAALFGLLGLSTVAVVFLSFTTTGCFGSPTLTVREKTVVGHELRLVVETSRKQRKLAINGCCTI